eukprot:TRINITY_DN35022_c0_g1_i1.p1 TRINITY_DN35022_c0_g1~~TRINITY_DN35022_c0_g1_i1.p1  ORF type:complete len:910 (+),score=193.53 TRINITY_DN35022_c0_g1_i1:174-2903(+)
MPKSATPILPALGDAVVDVQGGGSFWCPEDEEIEIDNAKTQNLELKLTGALSELEQTKGQLEAVKQRVSELETSQAKEEEEQKMEVSYNARAEIAKGLLSGVVVCAVFATCIGLLLTRRFEEGDALCDDAEDGEGGLLLRSCDICGRGTNIMPVGGDYEKRWAPWGRALLYFSVLIWAFQGVGIICEEFMTAIERIASTVRSKWVTDERGEKVEVKVLVWNETVANLSLMALGSSAPEILLSSVELCSGEFFAGSLGPQTVVGSAAFNLFVISSVCVSAIPVGDVRRIDKIQVFCFTSLVSVLAYLWMAIVLRVVSPDRVELWEGIVTLLFFFLFLVGAFMIDKRFAPAESKDEVGVSEEEIIEVHQMLEQRFAQPVSIDGVRAMMKQQTPMRPKEAQNTTIAARRDIVRASTGAKREGKQAACTYGYAEYDYQTQECSGTVTLQVHVTGEPYSESVKIGYRTTDGMAKAGKRYESKTGVLQFKPGQETQEITINIMQSGGPPEEFYVELVDIKTMGAASNAPVLNENSCCIIWIVEAADDRPSREVSTAETVGAGEDTSSGTSRTTAGTAGGRSERNRSVRTTSGTDTTSSTMASTMDANVTPATTDDRAKDTGASSELPNAMNRKLFTVRSGSSLGSGSDSNNSAKNSGNSSHSGNEPFSWSQWTDKAVEAFYCNGSPADQANATAFDWLCHCLALTWKVAFLFVPPTSLAGAWPAFLCSLTGIGIVTVVINDAASLLGCSIGMADDLTALTLVALGTSLPDTMASRMSARQDATADNAIGNVTGSNAVNVFLGMGISWTIGAVYWGQVGVTDDWKSHRSKKGTYEELFLPVYPEGGFIFPAGPIVFSVSVFSAGAFLCVLLFFVRRFAYGGELGGPMFAQHRDSILLLSLWIMFIASNILYDKMMN